MQKIFLNPVENVSRKNKKHWFFKNEGKDVICNNNYCDLNLSCQNYTQMQKGKVMSPEFLPNFFGELIPVCAYFKELQ